MPIAVNNLIGQTFNSLYDQRPVWAIASNSAAGANAAMVAFYGEDSPYTPLNVEYPGVAKSRTRNFSDEQGATYSFAGSTTAPTSNAWTPTSGYYGIGVSSQTGCLNNFDAYDSGNYGWYGTASSLAAQLACASGIVVGEPNWRQTFDLVLNPSGQLFKEEIGGGYTAAISGNKPFVNLLTDLAGGQFTSVTGNPFGWGQIAHNRNTGRLLIAQPNGGVNGTSLTFRLHIFDLQMKIGRATTIAQIKAAMQAAAATGSNRYRRVDVTFANTRCYYADNTTYDIADSQFVLCDNDEVWMFKSAETATTGTTCGNALFRVNLAGDWLTGTYTATFHAGWNATTQYGLQNSYQYGARHMNSDDNSIVALYQHYYYYNCGYHIAFVSTKNAGATSCNLATNDGASGETYTIAPAGGAAFVLCQSGANNDTAGPRIGFVDHQILTGGTVAPGFSTNLWPSLSTSTMYGANLVLKVQPTTEWK